MHLISWTLWSGSEQLQDPEKSNDYFTTQSWPLKK
jgi:hypothetical protein